MTTPKKLVFRRDELEMLALMATGCRQTEIARRLKYTKSMVGKRMFDIRYYAGVATNEQLMVRLVQEGIIT